MGMRDSLTAPPGKQRPAVRSGDSPAHLDRASLRGGSSCHVVFGTDNLKEPQAAAAGLFPPHLPRLTCVKTSCWLISKAPSEATFSAVRSSFCSFPAGPGWTEPLPVRVDLACGGKGTLLLFHTAHREESAQVFPLLARPSWHPAVLGSKETVSHPLKGTAAALLSLRGRAGFLGSLGCLLCCARTRTPRCRR